MRAFWKSEDCGVSDAVVLLNLSAMWPPQLVAGHGPRRRRTPFPLRGHPAACRGWAEAIEKEMWMISKRQEADRQFLKVSRKEKAQQTTSKSRSITDADKAKRDVKTTDLRKQREARDAGQAEGGLKKAP